jgi:hypothetical protein
MATIQELRQQLTAKVQAMPLGMLVESLDNMRARAGKDEAEMRVQVALAVDLSRRLRAMAREQSSDALLLELIDVMQLGTAARTYLEQETFRVMGDVLEERFPVAAEKAGEWLDTADFEKCNQDGYDYHRYLVAMIAAHQA